MPGQQLTFPDEEFSVAIHDAGMFTIKEISNRQLLPSLAEWVLRIIRERYADFGPTLACEKFAEIHGLYLAKETVRKLMAQACLWISHKLRAPRVHYIRHVRSVPAQESWFRLRA